MKQKEFKIYRDSEGNLTIEGKHENVAFTVTAKSENAAKEALQQLQRFEEREGLKVDKL
jgi:hypothetical protein